MSKVTVPTALYAGTNDFLADLKDVEHLVAHLPNSTVVATNIVKGFAHFVRFQHEPLQPRPRRLLSCCYRELLL